MMRAAVAGKMPQLTRRTQRAERDSTRDPGMSRHGNPAKCVLNGKRHRSEPRTSVGGMLDVAAADGDLRQGSLYVGGSPGCAMKCRPEAKTTATEWNVQRRVLAKRAAGMWAGERGSGHRAQEGSNPPK